MTKSRLKFWFVTFLSLAALCAGGFGIYRAVHSPLFLVRIVEVEDAPEGSPLDAQGVTELAAIPLGKINLFALDLKEVDARLRKHPWVRSVVLTKRFPQTVSVSVQFKEPRALAQLDGGAVTYIDSDGQPFGRVDTALARDLPMLEGLGQAIRRGDRSKIGPALQIIELWAKSGLEEDGAMISSVTYDEERGFRGLVTYTPKGKARSRLRVEFGHEIDAELEPQLVRLKQVIRYLTENGINARQILADSGKKIVVKIARGS